MAEALVGGHDDDDTDRSAVARQPNLLASPKTSLHQTLHFTSNYILLINEIFLKPTYEVMKMSSDTRCL